MNINELSKKDIDNLTLEETKKIFYIFLNKFEELQSRILVLEEENKMLREENRLLKGGNKNPKFPTSIKKPDPQTREPKDPKKKDLLDLSPLEILNLK